MISSKKTEKETSRLLFNTQNVVGIGLLSTMVMVIIFIQRKSSAALLKEYLKDVTEQIM